MNQNLYVDDYLDSAETEEEAINRAKEVKGILEKGDFHLTGWVSNSESGMQASQSNSGERKGEIPLADNDTEKILGVSWKPTLDVLTFRINDTTKTIFSRRRLLSKIAGTFDPLGLAAPLTVKAKTKLKTLHLKGLGWDEEILDVDKEWWRKWYEWMNE